MRQGSTGDAVRAVQSQIRSRGDGANQVAIDGIFGPTTDGAVRAFQTLLALAVDGIVGPQTWIHLVNGYLAAPDPDTAGTDVFSAWAANNRDLAGKNATPAAVTQLFAQTFSAADGWTFENFQGALGTIYGTWKRANGDVLRIGVLDAVQGPYYVADTVQFT